MRFFEPPFRAPVYPNMKSVSARPGLLALAACLSLLPLSAESDSREKEPLSADSRITTVHVFNGQALLVRKSTLTLPAGRSRIAFAELPEKLLDQTVRLRLKSASDLRLLDLRVETVVEKEFRSVEAEKAEKELKAAEQELREVTALYLAQMAQKKALSSVDLKPGENQRPVVSIERWKAIFGFVDQSLEAINQRLNALLGRIDGARRRLEIALTVAERYKSQSETRRKTVLVDLEAPRAGQYEIALEYGVDDAGWFPHYRLTLDESRASRPMVHLTSAVYIYNETGEDWSNARVSLSTADLTNPSRLPEIRKWTIASVIRPEREQVASKDSPSRSPMVQKSNDMDRLAAEEAYADEPSPEATSTTAYKPAPKKKEEKMIKQQQRMEQSVNEIRGYYEKNLADVKEDLADQKAREARDLMEDFRESVNKQESYYNNRDFSNARQFSNRTLEIIKRLSPSERARFEREIKQAEKIQSWSYEMEQSKRLRSQLTAPGSQVPGDFSMDAPLAVSVASDGVLRSVFISEDSFSATLSYEVSLNDAPGAYLTAAIDYTGKQALLSGPVEVYYGEDFGGTSQHPMVASGETYNLNLGRDPDIEIEREDREYETSEGLFGGKRAVRYETTFKIHNRRSYGITMDCYGAVPRSSDDRISIENVQLNPAPVEKEDNGIVRFRLNLKANERSSIRMSFQLIHDRDVLPVVRAAGGSR